MSNKLTLPTWSSIEEDITPDLINHYNVDSIRNMVYYLKMPDAFASSYNIGTNHVVPGSEPRPFKDSINAFLKTDSIEKATDYLVSHIHVDKEEWCHANAVKLRMLNSYTFAHAAYSSKYRNVIKARANNLSWYKIPETNTHCIKPWQNKASITNWYNQACTLSPFSSSFYLLNYQDVSKINRRTYAARKSSTTKVIGGEYMLAFRRYYSSNVDAVINNNEIPGVKYKSDLRASHVDFNFNIFDLRSARNNTSMSTMTQAGDHTAKRGSFIVYTRNSKPL